MLFRSVRGFLEREPDDVAGAHVLRDVLLAAQKEPVVLPTELAALFGPFGVVDLGMQLPEQFGFRVGDNAPMALVELVDRPEIAEEAAAE